MKREEKNLQSRRKILDSALREYAEKGYGLASINTICSAGGISKGILYHYFRDRDELYLTCVRECFEVLTAYLRARAVLEKGDAESGLRSYFDARLAFFRENPSYLRLFCEATLSPPAPLTGAIEKIREDFDALNVEILGAILDRVRLRPDVTKEEALGIFGQYQDFVNASDRTAELDVARREERCRRAVSILIYGVAARDEEGRS